MCKGRAFAMREMLLYASFIISFYDMIPPEGGSWEDPGTRKRAVTRHPTRPVKVWIRRRNITSEPASKGGGEMRDEPS